MNARVVSAVRYWIPIAVAVTALCGLVYIAAQQEYRMSLNDPQLQLAQDGALRLVDGAQPKDVGSPAKVDIAASLASWVMVYDASGKPISGGAQLEGKPPVLPQGVYAYAREHGEDRISWQPRRDVRQATIVEFWRGKSGTGFVVAGRNMREVEGRIASLNKLVIVAWLVTMAATFGAALVLWPPIVAEARAEEPPAKD
jgi:hypothetical protein